MFEFFKKGLIELCALLKLFLVIYVFQTAHLNGIVPHVSIDSRLTFIKDQPDTIQVVTIAIEKSIQENLAPVIERAIKIALTTCEQIIKQDFALDHDDQVWPLTQIS